MGFDKADQMREAPSILMMGSMSTEGTAEYANYKFTDSNGDQAEFSPDAEPPMILVKRPKLKKEDSYIVRSGYWRDVLK